MCLRGYYLMRTKKVSKGVFRTPKIGVIGFSAFKTIQHDVKTLYHIMYNNLLCLSQCLSSVRICFQGFDNTLNCQISMIN